MPQNGLPGGTWSAGSTAIAAAAGDAGDPSDPVGIFSRRSSDGGGVLRLTDAGTRFDYPVASSPDRSHLLFFRPDAKNETSDSAPQDLFVVGSDNQVYKLNLNNATGNAVGGYTATGSGAIL